MAFSTNLDDYSYSAHVDPCNVCCDPGKTPETMFLCFSEIQIGDLWTPADPPPPFGSYELTHIGTCDWKLIGADFTFLYHTVMGWSDVFVYTPILESCFWHPGDAPCLNWFTNFQQVPAGEKWFGGYCVLINTLPGGYPDITDQLKLMSDSTDWADWLSSVPRGANTASYQFSKHQDHTNVRILMDVP